ncbi:MAG: transposase [Candidatus Brockarchaeota archaeon]|nr:transposase [Candidatus Brockarchaeota archaeon]
MSYSFPSLLPSVTFIAELENRGTRLSTTVVNSARYKARWLGIKVMKVNERNTSRLCHRCGMKGIREGSLFECPHCNYACNADYNGAMNIMKRAMRYTRVTGAGLTQP